MNTRERYIEGHWTCSQCESDKIRGRLKSCPFCGSPRDLSEAHFDFGAADATTGKRTAQNVIDIDDLVLAADGADWYCANCDTANTGSGERCTGCGSSAKYAALSAPLPEGPPVAPTVPPPPKRRLLGAVLLGGVALLIMGGLLLTTCTREETATISKMSWSTQVVHERFTTTRHIGWRRDIDALGAPVMPVNGRGERPGAEQLEHCRIKEKKPAGCKTETQNVQCGTVERCKTTDLGNGFAKETCTDVPKYCDQEVERCWDADHEESCHYQSYQWTPIKTQQLRGSDNEPLWPTVLAQPLDRLTRSSTYVITLKSNKTDYTYTPNDEATFRSFSVGESVHASVNALGAVVRLKPTSP